MQFTDLGRTGRQTRSRPAAPKRQPRRSLACVLPAYQNSKIVASLRSFGRPNIQGMRVLVLLHERAAEHPWLVREAANRRQHRTYCNRSLVAYSFSIPLSGWGNLVLRR